jgi:internalin
MGGSKLRFFKRRRINKVKKLYVLISIFMCSLFLFTGCQKTYTITFDANGGICEVDTIDCKKKDTIYVPSEPTREGYTFLYWEKDGSQFDFNEAITSSFTLVAKWEIQKYDVIFDTDGGTYIEDQKVEYGKTIQVDNPTKEGYEFVGWSLNGEIYDVSTPIKNNLILLAIWTDVKYTVTFDVAGGDELEPIKIKNGESLGKIIPTKEHNSFVCWLLNGEVYDPTTPITSNITLVASWKEDYKVTIHYNNNDPDLVLYAKEGQSINDLGGIDSPIKEGYKFINFYYDEEFTKAMLIFSKINNDIDLYAKFSKIYYITYHLNGGTTKEELLTSYVVEDVENRNIDLVLPEKKGYFFRGWHEKEDCSDSNFYMITKKEARDITLFAKWDEATLQNAYLGILGDSISTYKGYIPNGFVHFPYYASSDDGGMITLEQTWWRITQQTLGCRLGINNSYSGTCVMNEYGYTTSAENISRLQHSTRFDNLPPDIMIIYMGNNDALVQNLNTANFEKSYRNMLNNLYTLYPNIQLFLGTLSYEKYFVGKDYYEEHVLVTAEVNRIIQSLASEYNLPIIDFATAYSDSSYLFDTIHPNVLGMKALANVAIDAISKFYNPTTI